MVFKVTGQSNVPYYSVKAVVCTERPIYNEYIILIE